MPKTDFSRQIAKLGGAGILDPSDIPSMNEAVLRVFMLMRDGEWHRAPVICLAAGRDGVPASEGLRRMRELRALFTIERRRVPDSNTWEYRLHGVAQKAGQQMEMFGG
jgi:hypothetical protein